ncbi:MAG: phosphoenolpyruvate synthase [Candidatus Fraserbacteria bacterium RBG_16_55_9]|uniref:Phosphoenolpyruvate synthase n=1 Tax=Fraserbacteria sp. (strain RBG_16_55_9) TaxID=1817864 RepID=A0A1F5V2J2_FRAXR|nr:MAG: phosphoenolpyruvate synthase [Candidatus Fraserbacteria bacterium RBG_16_55_9]
MKLIVPFEEISRDDVALVGGKTASIGELTRTLSARGVKVPPGFAITTDAYRLFVECAGIAPKIQALLKGFDPVDVEDLARRGRQVRALFKGAPLPQDLERAIRTAYQKMAQACGQRREPEVAARSSATSEDLAEASFAGQHESYLNVRGAEELLARVVDCFASLFTDRAISYRYNRGFDHFEAALGIAVQKMVRSDRAASGVMFTLDTETGFRNVIYIASSYGFGELVVQGRVNPDQFYVFKPMLRRDCCAILEKKRGSKQVMLVSPDGEALKVKKVPRKQQMRFSLEEREVLQLAKWGLLIEEHYKTPMDIEWAKDGLTGELFVVQARPETVHATKEIGVLETYVLEEPGKLIIQGEAVGSKVGQGEAQVILDAKEIAKFKPGQVLVTEMTDPDWEPIMKLASAIVTDRGGRVCHAAIVSRELGLPCVIGTEHASKIIQSGHKITVDCSENVGRVFQGILHFRVERISLTEIPATKTKIMMNVGLPEKAFLQTHIPNDGVGLAREEFIISSHIGIHPMALIEYEKLKKRAKSDKKIARLINKIDKRADCYEDKRQFFIDQLASGIGKIAAAFWPNDVIVRLSDFKTNEYAGLLGGFLYEPEESNPMLGWRGASRYYDADYKPAFGLECRALKKVRDTLGLVNVKVMVPFCRTPEEGRKVIETMAEFGLKQHENNLEVYVMCEIPSNVILAEEFCDIFDGFSIGSNDLTQLVLGLDRDSELVSHIYDERNEAVKRLVRQVIDVAKRRGKKIGICGQAPSDFPEFAEFLVECGIDSISLNPDTVIKTRLLIADKEKSLRN